MSINISQRQRSQNKFTAIVPNTEFPRSTYRHRGGRLFKVMFTENWKVLCDIKSMQNRRRHRCHRRLRINIIYTTMGQFVYLFLYFFPESVFTITGFTSRERVTTMTSTKIFFVSCYTVIIICVQQK